LNQTPNKKSLLKSPEQHDIDVSTASMLMVEPTVRLLDQHSSHTQIDLVYNCFHITIEDAVEQSDVDWVEIR
jgi:hypothetical protein